MWRKRIHQHNSVAQQDDGSERRVNKNNTLNIFHIYLNISLFFHCLFYLKKKNQVNRILSTV